MIALTLITTIGNKSPSTIKNTVISGKIVTSEVASYKGSAWVVKLKFAAIVDLEAINNYQTNLITINIT